MTNELYWTGVNVSRGALAFLLIIGFVIVFNLVQMAASILITRRTRKRAAEARRKIEAKGAQEGRREREMKVIQLTQNKAAVVDDEDFERLNQHRWCAHRHKRKGREIF